MRFDDEKFAFYYEERLNKEGYPGVLFDYIRPHIKGCKTIIDVGAGTGFFSIPFAEEGYSVTAIEPSAAMLNIFRKKIGPAVSTNIAMHNETWEKWDGEQADALICIHSIYLIDDIETALLKMKKFSKQTVMLVKSEIKSNSLSEIIRDYFGIDKSSKVFTSYIMDILTKNKISFTKNEITQLRTSRFTDLIKEAEYYCYHLKIDQNETDRVKEIIRKNSIFKNDQYYCESEYHDNLIVF